MKPARVIGAGLSGLATAWHLADRGFAVTVIDAAAGPGGLIQTRQTEHGLVETGRQRVRLERDGGRRGFERLELAPVFPRDDEQAPLHLSQRPRRGDGR